MNDTGSPIPSQRTKYKEAKECDAGKEEHKDKKKTNEKESVAIKEIVTVKDKEDDEKDKNPPHKKKVWNIIPGILTSIMGVDLVIMIDQ